MATFIAFLRAVNVGKRQVKMAGLRTELEANGFTDVATFIASGNVRVATTMRSAGKVEKELERVMETWLGFDVPTMVRTPKQLVTAYDAGGDLTSPVPGSPRHYVSFLKDTPPATAAKGCDGALVVAAPAPAPVVVAPPVAPPPPPPPAPPAATKVTYAADAFFDFDKAVLKPEGKAKLDDLVGKVKDINLEVIIAVGHTDWIGTVAYNQKLSVRRAEAVKAYLVSKGIEKNRVYTEGKGEKQPVASNKTKEGRQKNRRVEIEVIGTKK